jgi:hypothetical protein
MGARIGVLDSIVLRGVKKDGQVSDENFSSLSLGDVVPP